MEEYTLLDTIERYLNGSMSETEKTWFEAFRKNNADVDHKVVEQAVLFKKLTQLAERNNFMQVLESTHNTLETNGEIEPLVQKPKRGIISAIQKNWRTASVAASVAACITLFAWGISNKTGNNGKYVELNNKLSKIEKQTQRNSEALVNQKSNQGDITNSPYGGTGFFINNKGFIATSYHIIKNKKLTGIIDYKGIEYNAILVVFDLESDIAILKITDSIKIGNIPYTFSVKKHKLADDVYSLGFPYGSLGYSKGYLGSKTGKNGDSSYVQVNMSANPGQSGSPVIDNSGNIVGIVSAKQIAAEGMVFASKNKQLSSIIKKYNSNNTLDNISLNTNNILLGKDRSTAIETIEPFIIQVKAK
jgi:serine protease Do